MDSYDSRFSKVLVQNLSKLTNFFINNAKCHDQDFVHIFLEISAPVVPVIRAMHTLGIGHREGTDGQLQDTQVSSY